MTDEVKLLVERLRTSANESEMGRNLAGTPQSCREAADLIERLTPDGDGVTQADREAKPSAEAWQILENTARAWRMDVPKYMNDTVTAVQAARAIDRGLAIAAMSPDPIRKVMVEMREALTFYAGEWEQDVDAVLTANGWEGSVGTVQPTETLCNDFGQKARSALASADAVLGEGE